MLSRVEHCEIAQRQIEYEDDNFDEAHFRVRCGQGNVQDRRGHGGHGSVRDDSRLSVRDDSRLSTEQHIASFRSVLLKPRVATQLPGRDESSTGSRRLCKT